MSRPKITTAQILERHHRLDGATDMMVELTLADGAQHWLGVRESDDKLTGSWEIEVKAKPTKGMVFRPEPRLERKFVSVAKRRTLKAGIADLVEQQPALLQDSKGAGSTAYWGLSIDDRKQRERQFRLEREWRVHELTTWPDGRFLARLSCARHPHLSMAKCQLVLESLWGDGRVSAIGDFGSKRIEEADVTELLGALTTSWRRYKLGEFLAEVDNGFSEEREAKAAFERSARSRPGGTYQDFGVANAVRGSGMDRDTSIDLVETYEGHKAKAFLLSTSRGWYCMEVAYRGLSGGPMARFVDVWTGDTAYDTPVATARAILARTEKAGFSEEEARAQLRQLVVADIEWRWHSECVSGQWLVTAVADLPDGRLAVRGACVFPAAELLPLSAPRPVWRVVVTGMTPEERFEKPHATIIDLATGKPIPVIDEPDVERLRAAVAQLDGKAKQLIGETVLRRSRGFTDHAAADQAWADLVAGATVREIDGDVDPVPPTVTRLQLDLAYQARHEQVDAEMEGEQRAEALANLARARKPVWAERFSQVLEEEFPDRQAAAPAEPPAVEEGFDESYVDADVEQPIGTDRVVSLGEGWPTDVVLDCTVNLDLDGHPDPASWYALPLVEAIKQKRLPWPAAPLRQVVNRRRHFDESIDQLACGHELPTTEVWAGLTPRQRARAAEKPLPNKRRCPYCLAQQLAEGDNLAAIYHAEIARLEPFAAAEVDANKRERLNRRIEGLRLLLETLGRPLPPVVDGRIGEVPISLMLAWRSLEVTRHLTVEAWCSRFPDMDAGHLFAALIAAARDPQLTEAGRWQRWGDWARARDHINRQIDTLLGVMRDEIHVDADRHDETRNEKAVDTPTKLEKERARKARWAQKKRAEAKAAMEADGQPAPKRGRPRKYVDDAERQRAHRQRQQERGLKLLRLTVPHDQEEAVRAFIAGLTKSEGRGEG